MWQRSLQYPDWPREHRPVPLESLPRDLVWFVILSEDGRFFQHQGFDMIEAQKALSSAREPGSKPRGASTITMQTARSLFLWQGRSHLRKALEIYYAFWMERLLNKRRILELYLNFMETGPGVYGMEAGAWHHFDQSTQALSKKEKAMLVAILPNPLNWSPRQPSPRVILRQKRILERAVRWRAPAELESL